MLLIVEPRGQRGQRNEEEGRLAFARMQAFAADLKSRGLLRGVDSLLSDDRGTRVQVREGRRRVLDGPFAESKEMVGGYFLVDCATREQALAIAAECPAAQWPTVEVRETGPCFLWAPVERAPATWDWPRSSHRTRWWPHSKTGPRAACPTTRAPG